jgi:prepilin-type N-terminal cleavage/methylation domain-containing protein
MTPVLTPHGLNIRKERTTRPRAFTLIELLVVVAIIALLVSILLPSLNRAREQARIVACMANMSNLSKATITFAAEHHGYGPLLGEWVEWRKIDPDYRRYEYQSDYPPSGLDEPYLKCWQVAMASQLGELGLKRNEQFFEEGPDGGNPPNYNNNPSHYFDTFGKYEIFMCPSDKTLVYNIGFPVDRRPVSQYAVCSYMPNEDVLGVTGCNYKQGYSLDEFENYAGQPWKKDEATGVGLCGDTGGYGQPPRAKRLEGKLDDIIRPSEVVLFSDGGNEREPWNPVDLISDGAGIHGPYIQNMDFYRPGRVPGKRHSKKGGLSIALADGSGTYAKPIGPLVKTYSKTSKQPFMIPERYDKDIRVSPYKVGELPAQQP